MNIKNLLKNKIIKDILTVYNSDWSILIYDLIAGEIIADLFTKSELNTYSISETYLINSKKIEWDFPAIYLISGNKENFEIINQDFKNKLFSKFLVIIIDNKKKDLKYLNSLIKYELISFSIKTIEERIFIGEINQSIKSLEYLLNIKFNIFKMPFIDLEKLENENNDNGNNNNGNNNNGNEDEIKGDFLILDRIFDLFTPLIHFFTFKSIILEIENEFNYDDSNLYKEIRYKHMAEVNDIFQYNIKKINLNMEKLDKKLSTTELGKMVLDAPENIKLKKCLEKYSNQLKDGFSKLEYLQEKISNDSIFNNLIEAELLLATGLKNGEKIKIDLSGLFDLLGSTRILKKDKLRLLFLIKFKGLKLTHTEKEILKQSGFNSNDIDLELNLDYKYKRIREIETKYEISRFEPFLSDLIKDCYEGDLKSFLVKFNNLEIKDKKPIFSLRKSSMLTLKKNNKNKKTIGIYIKNGFTTEECRVIYELSEKLGIEIILGGDKLLNPKNIIEEISQMIKKNSN